MNLKLPEVEKSELSAPDWWLVGRYLADGHRGTRGDSFVSVGKEKIAEFEDENVLVSSSKFTALLADTNVNVTNMATGEEFKDISYDDLIDIIRSVPMKYKKGQPRWFMNQDIVKHIEKIKDLDGDPIFHSSRSLRDGQIESYLL